MPLDPVLAAKIRHAFHAGALKVRSVSPSGTHEWKPMTDVMRHDSAHKDIVRVSLENGQSAVVTVDHSLFLPGETIRPVRSDELKPRDSIVVVQGQVTAVGVRSVDPLPCRLYMYDICVPENESFVLSGSGILAHNSYSIGGVSLDIDKSSKYQSMMDSLQSSFDKSLEDAHMTIKVTKGLQQFRYGVGIRSAFGPHLGAGILSPRAFTRF